MVSDRAIRICACCLIVALTACSEARPLEFRIQFQPNVGIDSIAVVVARIRRGTCIASGDIVYSTEIRRGAPAVAEPPELPPGTYAFEAIASNAACTPVAEGCFELTLPASGPVVVQVSPVALPMPACPSSECSAGVCDGSRDAAIDAPDARPDGDAGRDIGPDATCAETEACNYADDDCDGRVDEGFVLARDPLNCGACGTVCAPYHGAARCAFGRCVVDGCDPGYDDCDEDGRNGCETDTTSSAHCGSCERQCISAAPLCQTAECVATCIPGFAQCGTDCVFGGDPDHCNACGVPCPERDHAYRTCSAGSCGFTCSAGYGDCNDRPDDGCEQQLVRAAKDDDHDGFGDPADATDECETPTGFVANADDCDDESPEIKPGAAETCNARDDDCDGLVDEGLYRVLSSTALGSDPVGSIPEIGFDSIAGPFAAYIGNDRKTIFVAFDSAGTSITDRNEIDSADDVQVATTRGANRVGYLGFNGGSVQYGIGPSIGMMSRLESPSMLATITATHLAPSSTSAVELDAVYTDGTQLRLLVFGDIGFVGEIGVDIPGFTGVRRIVTASADGARYLLTERSAGGGSSVELRALHGDGTTVGPLALLGSSETFEPGASRGLYGGMLGSTFVAAYGVRTSGEPRARVALFTLDDAGGLSRRGSGDLVVGSAIDAVSIGDDEIAIVSGGRLYRFDADGVAIPPVLPARSLPGSLARDPGGRRYYHLFEETSGLVLEVFGCDAAR